MKKKEEAEKTKELEEIEAVRKLLRINEQSGAEPSVKVYNDSKGKPTTATGLCLSDDNKTYANEIIATALSISKSDADKKRKQWCAEADTNKIVMTAQEARSLETAVVIKEMKLIKRKIIPDVYAKLKPHEVSTYCSLRMNGVFGRNILKMINEGNRVGVHKEIKEKSCAERNAPANSAKGKSAWGLQKRREKEAYYHETGEIISDQQATALLIENPSNKSLLEKHGDKHKTEINASKPYAPWAKEHLKNNLSEPSPETAVPDVAPPNIKASSVAEQVRYHSLNNLMQPPIYSPFAGTTYGSYFSAMYGGPIWSPFSSSRSNYWLASSFYQSQQRNAYEQFRSSVLLSCRLGMYNSFDVSRLDYSDQGTAKQSYADAVLRRGSYSSFGMFCRALSEVMSNVGSSYINSTFSSLLSATGLISSYNSLMGFGAIYRMLSSLGVIGGVATRSGKLTNLVDSPTHVLHDRHYFTFKLPDGNMPFTNEELQQVTAEVARGTYLDNTNPFFSLHFNEHGELYSVLHPAYENTLVGEVICLLDYLMKGFLNGGIYNTDFLCQWHQTRNADRNHLRSMLVDLKEYCRQNLANMRYVSLRELMAEHDLEGPDRDMSDNPGSIYKTRFRTSFRIIAKIKNVREQDGVFLFEPDFDVEHTVDLMPDYKAYLDKHRREHGMYPADYLKLKKLYETMKLKIKKDMPKLPIFRDYFQMLYVICFISYYTNTMKSIGRMPVLPKVASKRSVTVPPVLPPIPVRYYTFHKVKMSLKDVLERLKAQGIDLNAYCHERSEKMDSELSADFIAQLRQAILYIVQSQLPTEIKQHPIDTHFIDNQVLVLSSIVRINLSGVIARAQNLAHSILDYTPHVSVDRHAFNDCVTLSARITFLRAHLENIMKTAADANTHFLPENIAKEVEAEFAGGLIEIQKTMTKQMAIFQNKVAEIQNRKNKNSKQNLAKLIQKQHRKNLELVAKLKANIEQKIADFQALEATAREDLLAIIEEMIAEHKLKQPNFDENSARKKMIDLIPQQLKPITDLRQKWEQVLANLVKIDPMSQEVQKNIDEANTEIQQLQAIINEAVRVGQEIVIVKLGDRFKENIASLHMELAKIEFFNKNLNDIMLSNKKVDHNLLRGHYKHSNLAIADGGYYESTSDNFKVVGGCSVHLPTLVVEPLHKAEQVLWRKAVAHLPSQDGQFTMFDAGDEHYATFSMSTVPTVGTLYDYRQLAETIPNKNASFSEKEYQALAELFLPPTDEKITFNPKSTDAYGRTLLDRTSAFLDDARYEHVLTESEAVVGQPSVQGLYPIHTASSHGNLTAVQLLTARHPTMAGQLTPQHETPLMLAAGGGHTKVVRHLLSTAHHKLLHQSPNGLSAIWRAIQGRFVDTTLALLEFLQHHPAELNRAKDDGQTLLHEAIVQDLPEVAKRLIALNVDIYLNRHSDGLTAWHLAAKLGSTEIVAAILSHYQNKSFTHAGQAVTFDLNRTVEAETSQGATSKKGMAALHYAAAAGQKAVVELLLEQDGVDAEIVSYTDETALSLAIMSGHQDCAFTLSLKAGCEKDITLAGELRMFGVADNLVERSLSRLLNLTNTAAENYAYYLLIHGEEARYLQLLSANKINHHASYNGESSLSLAAQAGMVRSVKLLLDRKASFVSKNRHRALIHWMVIADDVGYLRRWMKSNKMANARIRGGIERGKSLLYLAAEHASRRCLRLLIRVSGKRAVVDAWYGRHLLDGAIRSGDFDTVKLLHQTITDFNQIINPFEDTPLILAAKLGLVKFLKPFSGWGGDILFTNDNGYSALHAAIEYNDLDLLEDMNKLIPIAQWPIEIWAYAKDKAKETTLHWLAASSSKKNTETEEDTANVVLLLHDAARRGSLSDVEASLCKGVAVDSVLDELTPLAVAIEHSQRNVVAALLAAGARIDVPETSQSALGVALCYRDIEIIQLFVKAGRTLPVIDSPFYKKLLPLIQEPNGSVNPFCAAVLNEHRFDNFDNAKNKLARALEYGDMVVLHHLNRQHFPFNRAHICHSDGKVSLASFDITSHPFIEPGDWLKQFDFKIAQYDCDGYSLLQYNPGEDGIEQIIETIRSYFPTQLADFLKMPYQRLSKVTVLDVLSTSYPKVLLDILDADRKHARYRDIDDNTLLHTVIRADSMLACVKLVKTPSLVNHANRYGVTPIMLAAALGNDVIVNLLLTHGADANLTDREGCNALHYALFKKQASTSILLLGRTRQLNTRSRNGITPLMLASSAGLTSVVRVLLAIGVEVSCTDNRGMCALHYAAQENHVEIISLLLAHGVDVNLRKDRTQAESGMNLTALHKAAINGHVDAARILLKAGADPSLETRSGKRSIDYALSASRPELLTLFQQHVEFMRPGKSYAMAASCFDTDNAENLRWLVTLGLNVNTVDAHTGYGYSLLHKAVKEKAVLCAKTLLALNADVTMTDTCGLTPLHCAAQSNSVSLIRALIQHGASMDVLDTNEMTPLAHAIKRGHRSAVMALLLSGAELTMQSAKAKSSVLLSLFQPDKQLMLLILLVSQKIPTPESLRNLPAYERAQVLHQIPLLKAVRTVWQQCASGGESLLHLALRLGAKPAIRYLLKERPILLQIKSLSGLSPTDLARQLDSTENQLLALVQHYSIGQTLQVSEEEMQSHRILPLHTTSQAASSGRFALFNLSRESASSTSGNNTRQKQGDLFGKGV